MNILVTGGAGYIGSITAIHLHEARMSPILFDNFSNSKRAVVDRIAKVTGARPRLIEGDVRNRTQLERALKEHNIEAVIHFAALKAVGESSERPIDYYENNVVGSITLLQAMRTCGIKTFIFSSSATVYAANQPMPLTERATIGTTNPYGESKRMVEQIMRDAVMAQPKVSFTALRYFNPVGAHPSGLLGEDPNGIPNNLTPYIAQVAIGRRDRLKIFGADYPTPDGTGVRDYLHVMDLAAGHVAALRYAHNRDGMHVFNLGTGRGHSVREVLAAFERACGRTLPYEIAPRRVGDVAENWADVSLAQRLLNWKASQGLDQMCADVWRWQSQNPQGYPAE
jgi:UDP-glucose 4-epimerase